MTPWIKWKEKAPSEADLPIECADYNYQKSCHWDYTPPSNYDLWRPYICDIPKAEEIKDMDKVIKEMANELAKSFTPWVNRLNEQVGIPWRVPVRTDEPKSPTPDANKWNKPHEYPTRMKLSCSISVEVRDCYDHSSVKTALFVGSSRKYFANGVELTGDFEWKYPEPTLEEIEAKTKNIEKQLLKSMIQTDKEDTGQIVPDANGWWRIEDRKPCIFEKILFCTPHGEIILAKSEENKCQSLYSGYSYEYVVGSKWKPLDMTGPEEK